MGRKTSLLIFLMFLVLAAVLWRDHQRDYWSFSPRAACRIVAEAGLEKAVSLSVMGDQTGWHRTLSHTDPALVAEALALLQGGEGRKIRWHGAPTPDEIWFFILADGREVLVGWWNVDRLEHLGDPTITGDVYGDFPAQGDRLSKVDRQRFNQIRKQLLW